MYLAPGWIAHNADLDVLSSSVTTPGAQQGGAGEKTGADPQDFPTRHHHLLGNARVTIRHMPQNDVVVRLFYTVLAGVVVHIDVDDPAAWRLEVVELLMGLDVLDRDHVDRTDQHAFVIIGEEGPGRQRLRVDVERAEAGDEVGQLDERADLLVRRGRRRLFAASGRDGRA